MKSKLGIRMGFAAAVMIALMITDVMLICHLLYDKRLLFHDRIVLTFNLGQRQMHVGIVSLLFTRFTVIVPWSLRILWRLVRQRPNELIILQGRVEFEDIEPPHPLRNGRKSHQPLTLPPEISSPPSVCYPLPSVLQ